MASLPESTLSNRRRAGWLPLVAAFVSLGLGVVSPILQLITGLPALVLGFLSLHRLNTLELEGPWFGSARRAAVGGMLLGLAGLVLGAISLLSLILVRVGETSRRTTCINQLRQIGQAVAAYENFHGSFPAAVVQENDGLLGFAPWRSTPYVQRLSWVASLVPFLGNPPATETEAPPLTPAAARQAARLDSLAQQLNPLRRWDGPPNREASQTVLAMFLCPSNPERGDRSEPALTHYVGMAGLGREAAEWSSSSPQAGFFGYARQVRRPERGPRDVLPRGLSNTWIAAETCQANGPWIAGGWPTVRGLVPDETPYLGRARPLGGLHPGGANLLMAGGEVRFFSERVEAQVLQTLVTLEE